MRMLGVEVRERRSRLVRSPDYRRPEYSGEDDRVELRPRRDRPDDADRLAARRLRTPRRSPRLAPCPVITSAAQNPVVFGDNSTQPAMALAAEPGRALADVRPGARRGRRHLALRPEGKAEIPLYARTRVPEAWVVDLAASVIEVYASPGSRRTLRRQADLRTRKRSCAPLP